MCDTPVLERVIGIVLGGKRANITVPVLQMTFIVIKQLSKEEP